MKTFFIYNDFNLHSYIKINVPKFTILISFSYTLMIRKNVTKINTELIQIWHLIFQEIVMIKNVLVMEFVKMHNASAILDGLDVTVKEEILC